MTCDELEVSLPEGAADEAVQGHLAQCESCREAAAVVALATQAALSPVERARLASLPLGVQSQWDRLQRRRAGARKFIGLAVAASLGAVIASGLMWNLKPVPLGAQPEAQPGSNDAAASAAEDESSFEVSWPTLNEEGDV